MKLHPLHIIAMLAAAIFAMFSIDTAGVHTSYHSYRAYGYSQGHDAPTDAGDVPLTVMQDDDTDFACIPVLEELATENRIPLQIPNPGLSTPPVALSASALTELTPVQLPPLDAGMVNVTGGFGENGQTAGYRVNPVPVEFAIAIPYDPSLLPQGFTEDDIQTYVYDRQYRRWVAIPRDSVNMEELQVCSRYRPWDKGLPHTQNAMVGPQEALAQVQDMMSVSAQGEGGGESPLDFINAVLKTPEMPETSAYTPTSIKELKAADPLEGLTLMQPPTANNMGTANLSYPIEIPAGRQGMQPSLALTYSSGGGNGWLGVGWDISIPSITVETRWGVPRYDGLKESEVYLYEGEQLVSYDSVAGRFRDLPHRTNQWTGRNILDHDGYEQFYPRKNEAYDSIVRHGSGPDSYWWTVTHKNGVTDYYGKYASDYIVNNSCVLRAGTTNYAGPIAHWALAESVDPYGNSVRYYYDVVFEAADISSTVEGKQIYINSIFYTNTSSEQGRYNVIFNRRDNSRQDVSVSANRGFIEVTKARLCNVTVLCGGTTVRTYMFFDTLGRFSNHKTRLTDVVRLDSICESPIGCVDSIVELSGKKITRTHFDYYDSPQGNAIFGDAKNIDLHNSNDNIHSFFVTNAFNVGGEGRASALGATKGKSWNVGGTATIGLGPVVPLTSLSVGGNFNYSRSKSEGLLTLIDLDGDGLADKLFKSGDTLYSRKQIADGDTSFHYGPKLPVAGASDFLVETGSTTTWGLQASAGCAYSGSWPKTTSTTSVYFSDVNGDGLPDLITDDGVLFNVTENGNDTVKFRDYHAMVNSGRGPEVTDSIVALPDECGGIIFDGMVSDSIACIIDREFVERRNIKEMGGADSAVVYADSLINTGEYECVFTYPGYDSTENNYVYENGWLDVYRKVVRCTPLSFDPDLETVKVWVAQHDGTVSISSSIRLLEDNTESHSQSKRRDGIQYAIQVCRKIEVDDQYRLYSFSPGVVLVRDSIPDSVHVPHDTTITGVSVIEGDLVMFRLISGESRSFDKVTWHQTIAYSGPGTPPGRGIDAYGMKSDVYDSEKDFLVSGNKHFQAHRGNSSYAMTIKSLPLSNLADSAKLYVYFTKNHVLDTDSLVLHGGQSQIFMKNDILADSDYIRICLTASNYGSFDVRPHIQYMFPDTINGVPVTDTVHYYPPVEALVNNYRNTRLDTVYHWLFGPLYRGWGQFAYNNNDTVGGVAVNDTVIKISRLVVDLRMHPASQSQANSDTASISHFQPCQETEQPQEQSNITQAFSSSGAYNPLSQNTGWVEMQPDSRHGAWIGYGNINYIVRDTMSNTRMVEYAADSSTADIVEYDHPVPVPTQGAGPKTVRKQNITKLKNHSLNLSVPVVPISVGVSYSEGESTIQTDYMDLNGDRYPDIIGEVYVQYSQPWGGIGPMQSLDQHVQTVSSSNTLSKGTNFGGSYSTPSRNTSNNPKNAKISFNGSGNAGASLGGGSDNAAFTWMDINGDGLPDKVNALGGTALNTGYGFLPFGDWNLTSVREGSSLNFGMNMGGSFNVGQASIGGGVGLNVSRNKSDRMLMDFNGDGLPDKVERKGAGIRTSYSLGAGCWSGWDTVGCIHHISYGKSYSESLDLSVTLGFTFFSILKVCVGVSGSPYGKSFSKDSVQLTDINGDGYVDYVTSSSEDHMTVRYNQSGKTNLLRKVTNFTGSTVELDYEMPPACYDKPQRSWNLAEVRLNNNDSLCPVGGNRTLTRFTYSSPNHNRYERMDYGYGIVITRQYNTNGGDTLYRYTVEEYNNRDFTKRGRKTRDCVYDTAGRPYIEHLYDAIVNDFAGSVVADGGCARTDVYVKNEVDITNWYEGGTSAQITSVVQREYDRHRNVVRYTHRGDTTHHDEWFQATIDYATGMPYNQTALPVQIVVKNYSGDTLQRRTASYYPKGKLNHLELHQTAGGNAQYDFTYDTCGNLVHILLPENDSLQRLDFRYQYDNFVHTYPVRVENHSLGFASTAEYNFMYGKPTRTVDINGNEMRYFYDFLGRTTMILAPYEIDTNKPYTIRMEYYPKNYGSLNIAASGGQSYAQTFHYDLQHFGNDITTTVIVDGLGRMMQTKKDAEIGGQEVSLVTGRVTYDCFSRTVAQYHPFTEPLGTEGDYNDSLTAGTATVTEYDVMDRQTRITQPYGYITTIDYGFETLGGKTFLRTETTDPKGNTTTVLCGTMGQQIRQIRPGNNVTQFVYDCLGRMTISTDPSNLQTNYIYDRLGRMTQRIHPDAGTDKYAYDPAGNMIYHVNGNGDTIKYRYSYKQLTDVMYPRYSANNVHYTYGTIADTAINAAGKVLLQEDGSGYQTFKYGKLGEITENNRTVILPGETRSYTFKTKFDYDSWNRIQSLTYPDGEIVTYRYNRGGMLYKVYGNVTRLFDDILIPNPKQGLSQPDDMAEEVPGNTANTVDRGPIVPPYVTYHYPYVDSVVYDRFELKEEVFYGNHMKVRYMYDSLQRLSTLQCSNTQNSEVLQNITYAYDRAGNITRISNSAGAVNGLGGQYIGNYSYDNLYRLTGANGWWKNTQDSLPFSVSMTYSPNGRILTKMVSARVWVGNIPQQTQYLNTYQYQANSNRVSTVMGSSRPRIQQMLQWDACGNMTFWFEQTDNKIMNVRTHAWTEDNRLQNVADYNYFSYYQYDASGERTCKLSWNAHVQNVNGVIAVYYTPETATLYPSPYLVITPIGYTKHYYAEAERITSQIGLGSFEDISTPVVGDSLVQTKIQAITANANFSTTLAQPDSGRFAYLDTLSDRHNATPTLYFYHPDHLGSSSWITGTSGAAVQHLHYLPWGEDFVNQRTTDYAARFTFSAKEKDAETGYSYFGSRYYSSDLSIWLSVDPMSDKYPSLSPYAYCANNPIKLVDPIGEEIGDFYDRKGNYLGNDGKQDGKIYLLKEGFCAKTDNKSVNWGETLEKKHADQLKDKSDEVGGLIIMRRIEEGDDYTISQYTTTGDAEGYFLEPAGPSTAEANQDKRMPEGVYDIDTYSSANFPDNFILSNKNVSKDRKILIHTGNTGKDTEGCLLPGNKKGQGSVSESKKNMSSLRSFIKSHNNKPIKLIINSSL